METKSFRRMAMFLATVITIFFVTLPAYAASYQTVSDDKTKIGSYYIWRPLNDEFHIQKVGSNSITKVSRNVYSVYGVTNGSTLFYTTLEGKHAGYVILYKYNIKTKRQKKIGKIKNSLHIAGYYKNYVYGKGNNNTIYRYNVKTKKKKTFLKNAMLGKSKGKYLYINKGGEQYRYDIVKKKMKKMHWNY